MAEGSEGELERVAAANDVPTDGGMVVELGEEEIAIFRLEDGFYALDNVCTHQGGPLGDGKVEEGCVYCPWHGHEFDIRSGEHGQMDHLDTRTFPVEERDGELYVRR